ncbi:MAG TPA: Mpo1-like protein, partial [Fluviicoccus sp.]|nr:Mpo1-like protein [Fluviicoccus sp.]
MKTLTDHLTMYAEYHRDKRNIATHFVGIPLIVLSITTLLSVPALSLSLGGLHL